MATRKPKKTSDHFIKSLNPRDADTKYLGEEPFFPTQPVEVERRVALARSFAWYNRFYGKKDAKELLAQYCDHYDRPNDAKTLRKVDEKEFLTTFCWLARMKLRGLELTDYEGSTLENEISRLLKVVAKPQLVEKEEKPNNRPNIQELMKEKASEAAGELEGLFDDLITTGKANSKVVDIVSKFNVMPQHIPLIVEIWKRKQTEFDELSQGQDKDLKEAYSHLGKVQIRNIIKFIEQVLGDLNSYISIKKASKAPRKRKAIPVEKIVSKLKYLKEFTELNLKSENPAKLVGASEAWLYDTAKRKLIHVMADAHLGTFTVKGSAIITFDAMTTVQKTLRKPAEQIKAVMSGGKPAMRKSFGDIKSTETKFTGRGNENIIILKAW